MAGLATVPALVKDIPDSQALAAALIENIQREDLNPLEEASGIQRLVQEFGLTHQAIAETLGRSRAAVTNLLRLLELAPPVRELLAQGRLDMGHARALLALPVAPQIELARLAAHKGLTVREVEQRVADALKGAAAAPAARRPRRRAPRGRMVRPPRHDRADQAARQTRRQARPRLPHARRARPAAREARAA